jgi:hypothetical protein
VIQLKNASVHDSRSLDAATGRTVHLEGAVEDESTENDVSEAMAELSVNGSLPTSPGFVQPPESLPVSQTVEFAESDLDEKLESDGEFQAQKTPGNWHATSGYDY